MTTYFDARDRIDAWIHGYEERDFPNDRLAVSFQDNPLYLSDIKTLLEKLASPCGSCHPCTEYADETWRAAGRKPPHVYEYDELVAFRARVIGAVLPPREDS